MHSKTVPNISNSVHTYYIYITAKRCYYDLFAITNVPNSVHSSDPLWCHDNL